MQEVLVQLVLERVVQRKWIGNFACSQNVGEQRPQLPDVGRAFCGFLHAVHVALIVED